MTIEAADPRSITVMTEGRREIETREMRMLGKGLH
jgi:hypothetical protein